MQLCRHWLKQVQAFVLGLQKDVEYLAMSEDMSVAHDDAWRKLLEHARDKMLCLVPEQGAAAAAAEPARPVRLGIRAWPLSFGIGVRTCAEGSCEMQTLGLPLAARNRPRPFRADHSTRAIAGRGTRLACDARAMECTPAAVCALLAEASMPATACTHTGGAAVATAGGAAAAGGVAPAPA